ncbi:hypothetical protein AcV5_003592 [Taiwanofungus camphoratus]|nr:hypothetical protein AcV5_003592 [Antrodia cinnamomea]
MLAMLIHLSLLVLIGFSVLSVFGVIISHGFNSAVTYCVQGTCQTGSRHGRARKKHFFACKDGLPLRHPYILDATRISDGRVVTLKKTSRSVHPYEADIGQFLSSVPLASDPQNHCVPIYDTLQVPDEEDSLILVMPFLRTYNSPSLTDAQSHRKGQWYHPTGGKCIREPRSTSDIGYTRSVHAIETAS